MRAAPAIPDPSTPEANDAEDAVDLQAARQLAALEELREIGMDLARALGRQVTRPASEDEARALAGIDVGLAYARIARAVRQIIAMEQEIVGLREARARRIVEDRAARAQALIDAAAAREEQAAAAIQRSVRHAVRNSIRAENPELERYEIDALLTDLFNDYDDYDRGAPAEIVTRICADLGIEPDLSIWIDPVTEGPDEAAAERDEDDDLAGLPPRRNGTGPRTDPPRNGHDPPC